MSSDLLQSLSDDYEYICEGGTAQFSSVHILRSPAGYVVAHQLSLEVSEKLPSTSDMLDTVRSITSLDRRLLGVSRIGTTTRGALFWATEPVSQRPIETAQLHIDGGAVVGADETARIGIEVCSILGGLHRENKFHGGITPAAIVIADEAIFLTEAGIEPALQSAGIETNHLPAALQSHFMSPEQLDTNRASVQSDIYSLGAALYQLLTGKPPFGGRTTAMIMATVLTDEAAPEAPAGGQEPGQVVHAILRAIEKDPADRWSSAEQFATALRDASTIKDPGAGSPETSRVTGCLPLIAVIASATGYGLSRIA